MMLMLMSGSVILKLKNLQPHCRKPSYYWFLAASADVLINTGREAQHCIYILFCFLSFSFQLKGELGLFVFYFREDQKGETKDGD